MVHKYKLSYFNGRGLAESIRYIFAQAGVPYEDHRFEKDDWPKIKPTTPMGQAPVLTVDGKDLAQSTAIARYLAKEHGLVPSDNWLAAKCDMLVDGIRDLYPNFKPVFEAKMAGDEAKMKERWQVFKKEHLNAWFDMYEKFLVENGGKFFVGDKLTWTDLLIAEFLDRITHIFEKEILANHKHLKAFVQHVNELPNIKKHIASRPETPF